MPILPGLECPSVAHGAATSNSGVRRMQCDRSNSRGRRPGILVAAVTCALAASQVQAVGLGGIEVKSKLNEPFVAEIPLNVDYRGQMDEMSVHLASPEEFERVGLQRPAQMSANLMFKVTRNARGEAVVLVTTPQKMTDPYVSFLLDVEWGNGKMVREYTAMLEPPHVTEVPHVSISAPTVATTPMPAPSVSPPEAHAVEPSAPPAENSPPAAAATAAPTSAASDASADTAPPPSSSPSPASSVEPAPEPVASTPPPEAVPPPPPPAPEPMPAPQVSTPPPAPPPAPVASSPDSITVGRGQTLSAIAAGIDPDGVSRNRVMIALQRANPDAFINGNINLMRAGAVLRIPDADAMRAITPDEANALVREQVESWRRGHGAAPQLQPVEGGTHAAAATAATASAAAVAGSAHGSVASTSTPAAAGKRPSGPHGARLEILPPAGQAGGQGQSGSAEGGAGSELRAQLAQSKEDLAARQAEIRDLKAHVADLEKIKTDSAKMIALKDSQMAALQARLAELEKKDAAAQTGSAASPAVTAAPASNAADASASAASAASPATPASPAVASPAAAVAKNKAPTPAGRAAPPQVPTPWYTHAYVLVGGGLLLFAGLLGLMLRRPGKGGEAPRRSAKAAAAPRRRNFDMTPSASRMQAAGAFAAVPSATTEPVAAAAQTVDESSRVTAEVAASPSHWVEEPAPEPQVPVGSGAQDDAVQDGVLEAEQPADRVESMAPEAYPAPEPVEAPSVPAVQPPPDGQWTVPARIEAARTCIENGDIDSARTMLEAALIDGNAAQQEEAFKLLDMIDSW